MSASGSLVRARLVFVAVWSVAGACTAPRPADTVVYASGADLESANPITTVHPLARQIERYALFVTLARLDSALVPQPYFARAWTWSSDRRSLDLALYRGLRWQDGRLTSAEDVAFTVDAARDPASGSPSAAGLASIERVDVVNDTAVTIRFRTPQPSMPSSLADLPIAPAHILASVARPDLARAGFAFAPIGNGPFRFVRRDPGRRWLFERVPGFPAALGGPPAIGRLVVTVVDEPAIKFAGLVSGDLDVAGIAPGAASLVEHDPSLRLLTYPVAQTQCLVFNPARPPFDDVRVRRAIDAVIDRRRVIDAALAGFASPADGPVPEEHPFHLTVPRPTVAAADSLLDAAGWRLGPDGRRSRGGVPFTFTLLTVGSGDNAIEQLVQDDLRSHGILMRIQQAELGAFLATARATPKRFDALLTIIPGDLDLSHLVSMFSSRFAGGALDYAGFHTPALDSLLARTQTAATTPQLAGAWQEVQRELARDVPVSWIYQSRGVQGLSRRLAHVHMDLRGELVTLTEWTTGDRPVTDRVASRRR